MPKVPMDYFKCCIYKIEHVDDESLVYVGHTTCFNKRKAQHKINCFNDNVKDYNFKVYQMIRENGGWEKFIMLEVEKYPCNDRREAERRENEVMKELKASMNMINSFRTEKEISEYHKDYRESNKSKIHEYQKEYYEENKEKIHERNKKYRELNKEYDKEYYKSNKPKIQEQNKKYRDTNREKMKEKEKNYRENNREKINAKVKCECGCDVMKRHLKEHQSTKKHLNIMKNMNVTIQ